MIAGPRSPSWSNLVTNHLYLLVRGATSEGYVLIGKTIEIYIVRGLARAHRAFVRVYACASIFLI